MFSLVSRHFIVRFYLATFDPDETTSLLILKLFCVLSQEPSVSVKLLRDSDGKSSPLLDCVCSTGILVAHWSSSSFVVVLKLMANCSHYE